jgi:outer membrane biosynthesis protein TonB
MAEASAATLTQLEKDHPRWQEEDELVPRHTQLLNEAFDGYLYPHLFHGAEEDLAARGLWAAAQLSSAQKQNTQAAEWAGDLTQLYQISPEATAAAAWLKQQPAAPAKPEPAAEAVESEDLSEESECGKPQPKPKSTPKKKPAKQKTKEEDEDA